MLHVKELDARFDVSAESKGVAGTIFVSVDAKGLNTESLESAVESRRGHQCAVLVGPSQKALRGNERELFCHVTYAT